MAERIPIDRYGEGNCCPECGSTRITEHQQRNLEVQINLATRRPFIMQKGKMKALSNRDKARAFDIADMDGGGGMWFFECRKCGWQSEVFRT